MHFDEDRFWSKKDGDMLLIGVALGGLEEVGRLQSVKFPRPDQECGEGDVLCTLRGEYGDLQLVSPEEGIVAEINASVMEDIEIVHDDPYEEGWLVRLSPNR